MPLIVVIFIGLKEADKESDEGYLMIVGNTVRQLAGSVLGSASGPGAGGSPENESVRWVRHIYKLQARACETRDTMVCLCGLPLFLYVCRHYCAR
jgi:hypothetical protein